MASPAEHSSTVGDADVVEGTIVRVTYENQETHFRVVRVKPHDAVTSKPKVRWPLTDSNPHGKNRPDENLVKVVGTMLPVVPGEDIRAVGRRERDARHGEQLRANIVTTVTTTSVEGITRY